MPATDEESEADFRSALRRAGVAVRPDRAPAMLEAYRELQALLALLDAPLAPADEPAAVLRLGGQPR